MEFEDKKVLVTGGSRGIGLAIASAFARQGARVAVVYRSNDEAAEAALSRLNKESNRSEAGHSLHRADVADAEQVRLVVDEAAAALGGLDVLVNNAGIGIYHPIETTNYQDWQDAWQKTLAANLVGPANLCFCAVKHMLAGGGRIVNVTSRGAYRGEPIKPAYGASKAGLTSLSQSLAVALAPKGIYVGAVAPGFVNTELTAERLASAEGDEIKAQSPFNRVAEPEEVAHAVLFLASQGAEFSTGTVVDVNGASYLR